MCRLITANFVHDSFAHLAGSSYALATVAPAIEEVLGWDIFLAVYLMSSLGGNVATFAFGDALTVGASSGIFGLIGGPQHNSFLALQASLTSTGNVFTFFRNDLWHAEHMFPFCVHPAGALCLRSSCPLCKEEGEQ